MNHALPLLAASALLAGCATIPDSPARNYIGNTFYVTPPGGKGRHYIRYNADGTFDSVFDDGSRYAGTWALKDDKVCYTGGRVNPGQAQTRCYAFDPNRKPGDAWTEGPMSLRLEKGRNGHLD